MPSRRQKTAEKQSKLTAPPGSDYKVGYCRPPREACFKKGQSGNPSGRPRGIKGLAGALERALAQRVTIDVKGRPRKMTKLDAMTLQLADLSAAGDARIMRLLLNEIRQAESRMAEEPAMQDTLEAADHEVIAALLARLGGK